MTDPVSIILFSAFGIGGLLGFVIAYSGFCTFGAMADWVSFGDRGRMGAWLLAMATAISGVLILSIVRKIDIEPSVIPYTSANFNPLRYALGGLLFGVGMHLAGGCSSKILVRLGGGSLKAGLICCVAAIISFALLYTTTFEKLIYPIISPFNLQLDAYGIRSQRLDVLLSHFLDVEIDNTFVFFIMALVVSGCSLTSIKQSARRRLLVSGLAVGGLVVLGWWITAGPLGAAWVEHLSFQWQPPRSLGAQSLTFISPLGDAAAYLIKPNRAHYLTFGLCAAVGLVFGSFVYHLCGRQLRLERPTSFGDVTRNVTAGLLLGVGGILALGCSIGQGVTGISTLALGSLLATASMCLGAGLAVKTEYYLLIYPNEASIVSAFFTSLVDFRLLPPACRRHEKA